MTSIEAALPAPRREQTLPSPTPKLPRRLGQKVISLFRTPELPATEGSEPRFLPTDVLFALAYRGAQLSRRHVEVLHRSGLPRPAFYLAMKAAEAHDDVQADLLRSIAAKGFNYSQLLPSDISPALTLLDDDNGRPGSFVSGEKLGQFSRHGFRQSVVEFETALDRSMADRQGTPLFMVANYPFIGLDKLANHSLAAGVTLGIIKPDRLNQTELPVGLMMQSTPDGIDVNVLHHDFERPAEAVIFDDVLNTGYVKGQVLDFWKKETRQLPDFVTAVQIHGPNSLTDSHLL